MKTLAILAALLVLALVGCSALGAPTDQAPAWVQLGDRLAHVEAKLVTPTAPTPENPRQVPQVIVQPPALPASDGNTPTTNTMLGAVGLGLGWGWYLLRKKAADDANRAAIAKAQADADAAKAQAATHDAAVKALAASVPLEVHSDAIAALAASTPTTVTETKAA